MPRPPQKLTPNQLERRQQIIDAAISVLGTEGASACTARRISAEGRFNNGLIHYYFDSVDEIVDAAAEQMAAVIVEEIGRRVEQNPDPAERFWAVVEHHLSAFASPPGRTVMWMDYWVSAVRNGRRSVIARIDDAIIAALAESLGAAGIPDAELRGRAICSYVTGAAIRREVKPQTRKALREEIALMSGGISIRQVT